MRIGHLSSSYSKPLNAANCSCHQLVCSISRAASGLESQLRALGRCLHHQEQELWTTRRRRRFLRPGMGGTQRGILARYQNWSWASRKQNRAQRKERQGTQYRGLWLQGRQHQVLCCLNSHLHSRVLHCCFAFNEWAGNASTLFSTGPQWSTHKFQYVSAALLPAERRPNHCISTVTLQ